MSVQSSVKDRAAGLEHDLIRQHSRDPELQSSGDSESQEKRDLGLWLQESINRTGRCEYCANLTISALVKFAEKEEGMRGKINYFPKTHYYRHHHHFSNLEKSAQRGCDLCALILQGFKDMPEDHRWWSDYRPPGAPSPLNSLYTAAKSSDADVRIAITCKHLTFGTSVKNADVLDKILVQVGQGLDMNRLCLALTTVQDQDSYISNHRVGRYEDDSHLGSNANMSIARKWLHVCSTTHHKCRTISTSWSPTRLIDVGTGEDLHQIRIVSTQDVGTGPYMALSHCWGGDIATKLTRENVGLYQQQLPYDKLPANFRDAITIARGLGLRYVWIDSLCIVQDSTEDWAHESKNMGLVYLNATVTLCASFAKNSNEGILLPRQHSRSVLLRVEPARPEQVTVQAFPHHQEDLKDLEQYAPLRNRGWALQEDVLSPRRLIYGIEQMYWICTEITQSSAGLIRPRYYFAEFSGLWNRLLAVLHASVLPHALSKPLDISQLLLYYRDLIIEYSKRRLSKVSDKLPALSGICERLHPLLGGDFVAGLWSIDLPQALLWSEDETSTTCACKHDRPYRGPTWSWTTAASRVRYVDETFKQWNDPSIDCTFQYTVRLKSEENPYGEVLSASLVADGLVMPLIDQYYNVLWRDYEKTAEYSQDKQQDALDRIQSKTFSLISPWGETFIRCTLRCSECIDNPITDKVESWGASVFSDFVDHAVILEAPVHIALLLGFEDHSSESYVSFAKIQGLVLQKFGSSDDNVCERIGMFSFETDSPMDYYPRHWTRKTVTII